MQVSHLLVLRPGGGFKIWYMNPQPTTTSTTTTQATLAENVELFFRSKSMCTPGQSETGTLCCCRAPLLPSTVRAGQHDYERSPKAATLILGLVPGDVSEHMEILHVHSAEPTPVGTVCTCLTNTVDLAMLAGSVGVGYDSQHTCE